MFANFRMKSAVYLPPLTRGKTKLISVKLKGEMHENIVHKREEKRYEIYFRFVLRNLISSGSKRTVFRRLRRKVRPANSSVRSPSSSELG